MAGYVTSLRAYLSIQCGAALRWAKLDDSAAGAPLDGPVSAAAGELGVPLADPFHAADADLVGLTQEQVLKLRDVAEYLTLCLVVQSDTSYDVTVSKLSQKLGSFRADLLKRVEELALLLSSKYGYGLNAAVAVDSGDPGDDPAWRVPRDYNSAVRHINYRPPPGSAIPAGGYFGGEPPAYGGGFGPGAL